MQLRIENLRKAFGEKTVLDGISLDIGLSDVTILMGTSGCGKTTLLHCILGLIKPDSGHVRGLDGKRFSAVFQEDRLLPWADSIQNIRFVDDKANAEQMLKELGMAEDCRKPVTQLSGGMRRRVAVARAMAFESDFIIMDEPLKELDAVTKAMTAEFILRHRKKRGIIVSTHDEGDGELLKAASVIRLG